MEKKTIATAVVTTVAVGAIAATMILAPITNELTTQPEPTPTAIIEIITAPTPIATLIASATPTASVIATSTPIKTATPIATPAAVAMQNQQHIATLEDYTIRTTLDDGTVIVTYDPDTPQELLEPLIPRPKEKAVNNDGK